MAHRDTATARPRGRVIMAGRRPAHLSRVAELIAPDAAICAAESDLAEQVGKVTDGRMLIWLLRRPGPELCRSRPSAAWRRAGGSACTAGCRQDVTAGVRHEPRPLPRANGLRHQRRQPGADRLGPRPHRLRDGHQSHHAPLPVRSVRQCADHHDKRPGDQGQDRDMTAASPPRRRHR